METRHCACQIGNLRCRQHAAFEPAFERGVVRQPGHLHGPFDGWAGAFDRDAAVVSHDRHNAEVNPRAEPAIQAYLFFAVMVAQSQSAKIEKAQRDRLLHLVNELAGQKHHGNVRLPDLDLLDRVWISLRIAEGVDKLRQIHETRSPYLDVKLVLVTSSPLPALRERG